MLDATIVVRFCQPSIPLAEGQASVLRYDFSDPQSGKDFCDRKIVPCKQRLPHHVTENHNMESAKDIKKGLESPPGIAGASFAECKINQSVTSAGATNNNILGITKYDDFSHTTTYAGSGQL